MNLSFHQWHYPSSDEFCALLINYSYYLFIYYVIVNQITCMLLRYDKPKTNRFYAYMKE